jgi:hypothetical protein
VNSAQDRVVKQSEGFQVSSDARYKILRWLVRLTANAEVATVLGSIPAYSDTVKSEGRQMKQY